STHLVHRALRDTLGPHVRQMGSFVGDERLRFDFAHQGSMSDEQIDVVKDCVNAVIRQNGPVETKVMGYDDAIASGAMALFGEKYGDEVRVVTMGDDPAAEENPYSVELCGGTHVERLGEIGLFEITAETGVSAGVRRIEALTGERARKWLEGQSTIAKQAAAALKTVPTELPTRIEALLAERKKMERELAEAKKKLAMGGGTGGGYEPETLAGVKFIGRVLSDVSAKDLRGLVDQAKQTMGSGVAAFVSTLNGKAALTVGVTDDLHERLSAVDLVKAGSAAVGGKGGGGRADLAQAGGPNGQDAEAAIKAIRDHLAAAA
ncbi:MAG: DHHA1 domain-containing protein, partial [Pseudomonadota bacterium]